MIREVIMVFQMDFDTFPEECMVPLDRFADELQEAVDVTYQVQGEDGYLSDKNLTHLIIRDIEDGDEKAVIFRRYTPEEIELVDATTI